MKECILAEHEVWADVPGYAGLYEVSNFGRIRSLTRTTTQRNNGKYRVHTYSGKILSLSEDENGYLRAHVSKNGKDDNADAPNCRIRFLRAKTRMRHCESFGLQPEQQQGG